MSEGCQQTNLLPLTRRVQTGVPSAGVQVCHRRTNRGGQLEKRRHTCVHKWNRNLRRIPGDFSWKNIRILKAEGLTLGRGSASSSDLRWVFGVGAGDFCLVVSVMQAETQALAWAVVVNDSRFFPPFPQWDITHCYWYLSGTSKTFYSGVCWSVIAPVVHSSLRSVFVLTQIKSLLNFYWAIKSERKKIILPPVLSVRF